MYDLDFIDTSNTLLDVIVGINDTSGKVLFGGILLLLFMIVFIGSKRYDTNTALLAASTITTVVGGLLMATGLLAWQIAIIPMILLLIMLVINIWSQ